MLTVSTVRTLQPWILVSAQRLTLNALILSSPFNFFYMWGFFKIYECSWVTLFGKLSQESFGGGWGGQPERKSSALCPRYQDTAALSLCRPLCQGPPSVCKWVTKWLGAQLPQCYIALRVTEEDERRWVTTLNQWVGLAWSTCLSYQVEKKRRACVLELPAPS